MKVAIVGAGLAGLVCGLELQKNGVEVSIYEASDAVGGRVRTDVVDGFLIDRGFQVLFDAYPAVKRQLDLHRLHLQPFDPGAVICERGRQHILTDPIRDGDVSDIASALLTNIVPLPDKLRTLKLSQDVRTDDWAQDSRDLSERGAEDSAEEFLRAHGFSTRVIDLFFRPFYGGIFLDRSLATSSAAFQFYFRMMSEGLTAVPANGMGTISAQLAEPLAASGALHLNSQISRLRRKGKRINGLITADGSEFNADIVVLAVDAEVARSFCEVSTPTKFVGCTTVYFAGDKAITQRRKIYLNGNANAFVNNLQPLSVVAPAYSPVDRHLVSATVLGVQDVSDEAIYKQAIADMRHMLQQDKEASRALASYSPLCIRRIPKAQFAQGPGVMPTLPGNTGSERGLYFAAEWTQSSSINGAMVSGEKCARAIIGTLQN